MSDLAVQNRESEQEVMPSFDFLLERRRNRNTLLAEHRAWLKRKSSRNARFPKHITVWRYTSATSTRPAMRTISQLIKSNFLIHWLSAQTGSLSVSMWTRAALRPIWRTLRVVKAPSRLLRGKGRSDYYPESKQYLEEALRALFLYAPLGSTPKASGRLLRFGGYLYAGFLLPGGSTRPVLFARSRLEDTP